VSRILQKQGYTFIQLGSWWNATRTSQYADRNLRHGYGITLMGYSFQVSEFIGVFIQRTIFWSVLEGGLRFRGAAIAAWDGGTGQIFLDQTRELEKIASEGGAPRFVFTHLLMPHLPTVFDSDGRPTPPGLSEKEAYLRQVQFTNSKLIEQVRNIQATERGRQAVIVLASDEGQFPDNNTITATDQQLRHKSNTLASLYFPDHDYSLLYPAITPVNYFRVIFNKYFGTRLDFQPDTVFAYRRSSLFLLDLADVTKRVRPIGLLEPGAGLF